LHLEIRKKTVMRDEHYWKEIALERKKDKKALKARIVEIIEGREKWKAKAMQFQEENKELKKRLNEIKKNLSHLRIQ
jgi:hypothetical protein